MTKTEWWKHLDHELGQLIELHQAFQAPGFTDLPEIARRSMDVAYAAHFRALIEFAHSGRPSRSDWRVLPQETVEDISSKALLGTSMRSSWDPDELRRLRDADKLVGHLSAGRVIREGSPREWGDQPDLDIWRVVAESLIANYAEKLPRAARAWEEGFRHGRVTLSTLCRGRAIATDAE